MPNHRTLHVEVVYALAREQALVAVEVPEGATIEEAIRRSGLLERYPEIELGRNKVGVFGHAQKLENTLRERDRVEIYRPIQCDPKEVRRQRAKSGKKSAD
ncbi:MAG: RnfH family protein [Thiotrichales bacterium]